MYKVNRVRAFIAGLLFLLSFSKAMSDSIPVIVIGYDFPPYVYSDSRTGISFEFIKLLNSVQNDYQFSFRLTSANRRYKDLSENRGDIILFEMPEWGWKKRDVKFSASREIGHGGEVYIAKKIAGRDLTYFDNIADKDIAGIMGFHYGFANFNADHDWLYKNFKIHLGTDREAIIRLVDLERVELAVVTKAFLLDFFEQNPEFKDRLLISEKLDQEYHLRALIRDGSPIDIKKFESILEGLTKSGELKEFQRRYKSELH